MDIYILFIIIFSAAIVITLASFIGKYYFLYEKNKEKKVVMKIIPAQNNEKTPNTAENFFSILHGLYKPLSWKEKFFQKEQSCFSLEIVRNKEKIHFYIRANASEIIFISSQIHAHYPEAEMQEVEDFLDFSKKNIQWNSLYIANSSLWPIKRYSQFESTSQNATTFHDPLSGTLQSLSDAIGKNEMAGIQIAIRPYDDELFREKVEYTLKKTGNRNLDTLKNLFEKTLLSSGFWNWVLKLPLRWGLFIITRQKKDEMGNIEETQIEAEHKQSHERETLQASASDKMSRLVFETDIRVFHAIPKKQPKKFITQQIISSFKQYSLPHLNGFTSENFSYKKEKIENKWKNIWIEKERTILSNEELATIFHLPHISVQNPFVDWVSSKKIASPHNTPMVPEKNITLLGKTNFRGQQKKFGIRPDDRRRHIYMAGKTGMGKSTLLENMIFSDIQNGKGVAIIDPHGDLADAVLHFVPKNRTNDVIIFDPSDREFPISFNILECPDSEKKHLVASGVLGVFKKMFAESWGPRLEHILRNTLLALIEAGGQSILGILRMLADDKYRLEILKRVKDPIVLSFWNDEFGKWQPRQRTEAVSPIQNKVGQFLSSSIVRNILGQTKSSFSLRFAMDTKKIMIINLSKGNIGEDISNLLGAMLITKFQLDVMSRSDIAEKDRTDFYLYVDEFQNFATQSFATILSEARKYKLNLTVANQYLAQMEDEVREAIFGNVGTLITFQVGFDDAKVLSDQFGGEEMILPADIGSLPKYQTYLRLMIDGMPSSVFSSNTLPPPQNNHDKKQIEKIKKFSRERYAKPRKKVEEQIMKWSWSKR